MVNSPLLFTRGILSLNTGQYGFDDIARRILTTKVSLLGSGPDENRNKTGYGLSGFPADGLTFFFTENPIRPVNSSPRLGWFGVHNLQHPVWLPVTEGDERRAVA